jgi:hypothetical protein
VLAFLLHGTASAVRAETVAWWRFDEASSSGETMYFRDSGPNRFHLKVGAAGKLAAGRFGNALRGEQNMLAGIRTRTNDADGAFVAGIFSGDRADGGTASSGGIGGAALLDSKLNLGAWDWTVEFWLMLDDATREDGVILELRSGREDEGVATRLSVAAGATGFVFEGLATPTGAAFEALASRIELPNPEGPPARVALRQRIELACGEDGLLRGQWLHVAVVHSAADETVRAYVDGKPRAAARMAVMALPRNARAFLALGSDIRGARVLAGAIDELRVSARADYVAEFLPPTKADAR